MDPGPSDQANGSHEDDHYQLPSGAFGVIPSHRTRSGPIRPVSSVFQDETELSIAPEILAKSRQNEFGILTSLAVKKRMTLYDFLRAQKDANIPYNPQRYLSYSRQITRAVKFLLDKGIYSFTPCPHSIYLDEENVNLQLGDSSNLLQIDLMAWKSYEQIRFHTNYVPKSSIFSLGMNFHFLWSYGFHPYGTSPTTCVSALMRGDHADIGPILMQPLTITQLLLQKMLNPDRSQRPTIPDIISQLTTLSPTLHLYRQTIRQRQLMPPEPTPETNPNILRFGDDLHPGHFGLPVSRPRVPDDVPGLLTVRHSLYSRIRARNLHRIPFNSDLYLSYSKQIAGGLNFLNKSQILDCDLNPIAITLNKSAAIIIISDYIHPEAEIKSHSPEQDHKVWKTPEEYPENRRIPLLSDIFSLGVIFHILWSNGNHPFGGNPHEWCNAIRQHHRPQFSDLLIPHKQYAIHILNSMLQIDPDKRPKLKEVLRRLNLLIKGPQSLLSTFSGSPTRISNIKQIETLTDILDFGAEIVPRLRKNLKHLNSIEVKDRMITIGHITTIGKIIRYPIQIQKIDLSFCHLQAGSITHLRTAANPKTKVLSFCVFGNPHLTVEDLVDGIKFVAQKNVKANYQFDDSRLPREDQLKIDSFMWAFQLQSTRDATRRYVELKKDLRTIDFNNKKVTENALRAIAIAIKFSTELDEINLTNSDLQPGSLCLLNELVTSRCKVKFIYAMNNHRLTDDDIVAGVNLSARLGGEIRFGHQPPDSQEIQRLTILEAFRGQPLPLSVVRTLALIANVETELTAIDFTKCSLEPGSICLLNEEITSAQLKVHRICITENEDLTADDLIAGLKLCARVKAQFEFDDSFLNEEGYKKYSKYRAKLGVPILNVRRSQKKPAKKLDEVPISNPKEPPKSKAQLYEIPLLNPREPREPEKKLDEGEVLAGKEATGGNVQILNLPDNAQQRIEDMEIAQLSEEEEGADISSLLPSGDDIQLQGGIQSLSSVLNPSESRIVQLRGPFMPHVIVQGDSLLTGLESHGMRLPIQPDSVDQLAVDQQQRRARERGMPRAVIGPILSERYIISEDITLYIGPNGGKIEVGGCVITFPPGCFDDVSKVYAKAEIDSSKWPPNYICITAMLWVESQRKLLTGASVRMTSWCMKDCEDSRKIFVDVLHQNNGSQTWDVVARLPLNDQKEFSFDCTDFSPYVLGIPDNELPATDLVVESHVYAGRENFALAFFLQHALIKEDVKKTMAERECKLQLNLTPIPVKIDDNIFGNLLCKDESFQFVKECKKAFRIDKDFVRLQRRAFCNSVLTGTSNEVLPILFECEVKKNQVLVEDPQFFSYHWKPVKPVMQQQQGPGTMRLTAEIPGATGVRDLHLLGTGNHHDFRQQAVTLLPGPENSEKRNSDGVDGSVAKPSSSVSTWTKNQGNLAVAATVVFVALVAYYLQQ